MGKSVAEYSPTNGSGYLDWCEAFAPVADASISDCDAGDTMSDDIVFSMPSSSIVRGLVKNERMRYGPSLGRSTFKCKSFGSPSEAVTANGGCSM